MKNFSLFLIILAGILIWQATDLLILQADAETLRPSPTKKSPTIRKQHSPYQLAPGNNASAIEENDLTDRMNEAIEEENEQIKNMEEEAEDLEEQLKSLEEGDGG